MLGLINLCVTASLIVYLLFATGSYATFNSEDTPINPNIIQNYPMKGAQFILARFLYIFLLTFSYPMMTFPARESIFKIIQYYYPTFFQKHYKKIYFVIVTFILLFTWLIACINPPLDFVLGLFGSTAAPIICFFLPPVFWLKIDPNASRWNALRLACIALLAFAVISTGLSITALVISVVVK